MSYAGSGLETVPKRDGRFFRRLGATVYGCALFSTRVDRFDFSSRFHGNDERIDVDSLRLTAQLWDGLARELLS